MRSSQKRSRQNAQIGPLLRERRRQLAMTLEAVSEAAEITKGFLSEVERDKASPSVATLVRLCEVLNLSVGSLFSQTGSAVVRVGERAPIKFGGIGVSDYLLTPSGAARCQAILSNIAPGGTGGDALYRLRSEEEFVFVLKGRVDIVVDDEVATLEAGDAMTFDPRRAHTFRNNSKTKPACALFILMPPPA
jgi:transcriptional regulator with XRE-family HTH domain